MASDHPIPREPATSAEKEIRSTSAKARLTVLNESGLHLRVALRIVETARDLPDEVELVSPERSADAKGMLELMGLAALQGTELVVIVRGPSAPTSLRTFLASLSHEEFSIQPHDDFE